jgi:hypothetical protein
MVSSPHQLMDAKPAAEKRRTEVRIDGDGAG